MMLLASAAALTLRDGRGIAQRVHFSALLALPYVAAAVQLAEGRAPPASLRILAGLTVRRWHGLQALSAGHSLAG